MGQPLWLRRASAASRYALGACSASMAWVLRARAPAASLITASCSALGAEGAARLCTLQRGQPLAAIDASRYALGADGVGAARPGAYMCCAPITCARCLLGVVGMLKTSCALR